MDSEGADQQAVVKQEERSCDGCNQSLPAQSWCYQCAQALCLQCNLAHVNLKCYKEHIVVLLCEVTEEEMRKYTTEERCERHRKKLKFYCQDCDVPACSTCAILLHSGHRMIELEAVLEEKKEEVLSWCQKVETALPAFQAREASSHVRLRKLQDRIRWVETLFEDIISKVKDRENQVVADLQIKAEGQKKVLEEQHRRDQDTVESAEAMVEEGRRVASLALSTQLTVQPKIMEERFKEFTASGEAAVEPLSDLMISKGELAALMTYLEKIGEVVELPSSSHNNEMICDTLDQANLSSSEPATQVSCAPSGDSRPKSAQSCAKAASTSSSLSTLAPTSFSLSTLAPSSSFLSTLAPTSSSSSILAPTSDGQTSTLKATFSPESTGGPNLDSTQKFVQDSPSRPSNTPPLVSSPDPLTPALKRQTKRSAGSPRGGSPPRKSCPRVLVEPVPSGDSRPKSVQSCAEAAPTSSSLSTLAPSSSSLSTLAPSSSSLSTLAPTSDGQTLTLKATFSPESTGGHTLDFMLEFVQDSLSCPSNAPPLMSSPDPLTPALERQTKRSAGSPRGGSPPLVEPECITISSDEDEPGALGAPTSSVADDPFFSCMRTDSSSSQHRASFTGLLNAGDADDIFPERPTSKTVNPSRTRGPVQRKSKSSSKESGSKESGSKESGSKEKELDRSFGHLRDSPQDFLVMPHTVMVGSLRMVPTAPVVFGDLRIKFRVKIAALSNEEWKEVTFEVYPTELELVQASFERPQLLIFLRTNLQCTKRVQSTLFMGLPDTPFYNPYDSWKQYIVLNMEEGIDRDQVIQHFDRVNPNLLTELTNDEAIRLLATMAPLT